MGIICLQIIPFELPLIELLSYIQQQKEKLNRGRFLLNGTLEPGPFKRSYMQNSTLQAITEPLGDWAE